MADNLFYEDFDGYTVQSSQNSVVEIDGNKVLKMNRVTDERANRNTKDNISIDDYDYFKKLFSENPCYICQAKFTELNKPTLDRIDNKKGHSKDNVKPCCSYCNITKSDKDENLTRLRIQLRNYALLNNLPMTIDNEYAYNKLRKGITGGLSNVQHRVNIAGKTHINHFKYENNKVFSEGKVISYDTPHIMTHFCGVDFNSLYPSAFSSKNNLNNPYTNHKMLMPGRIDKILTDKNDCLKIINSRDTLFLATIKGHINEKYINDFINFSPNI